MQIPIDSIVIGERIRKNMKDLKSLADSIAMNGQLQPIGIDADNNLIFGERRIRAMKSLGRDFIEAIVLNLDDKLQAEHDENEVRAEFTKSERAAWGRAMEAREEERA